MPATSWRCFAPHCEDPQSALERARQTVFASGRYRIPIAEAQELLEDLTDRSPLPTSFADATHRYWKSVLGLAGADAQSPPASGARAGQSDPGPALQPSFGISGPDGHDLLVVSEVRRPSASLSAPAPIPAAGPDPLIEDEPENAQLSELAQYSRRIDYALSSGVLDGLDRDERRLVSTMRIVMRNPVIQRELERLALEARESAQRVVDGRPRSLTDIAQIDPAVGTHSVLDIELALKPAKTGLFARPQVKRTPGAAVALTPRELKRFFGALKPTREQIEAALEDVHASLGDWECVYCVVYESGRPTQICFIGKTGG